MQRTGPRYKAFRLRRSLGMSPWDLEQHCEQAVSPGIEPWMDEGKPEPSDGDGEGEPEPSCHPLLR